LVAAKEASPSDDLLSRLLDRRADSDVSRDEGDRGVVAFGPGVGEEVGAAGGAEGGVTAA
jgi:hypothetical protein